MRTLATIVYRALYAVGWVMGHGEELTGRVLRFVGLMLVCVLCGGCWMQPHAIHIEVSADNARVDVED